MGKGQLYPSESRSFTDPDTGAACRQITDHPSIHHHPFFYIPAWDDEMTSLYFVSHRTGKPQVFREIRESCELQQLTDRPDLGEWSVFPSHNGKYVFFKTATAAWRLDTQTLEEEQLVDFSSVVKADTGMVGSAMGTSALSHNDRWWAFTVKMDEGYRFVVVETDTGRHEVILERDTIGHPQFRPDDDGLILYAGPLTDRVWRIQRDGNNHTRIYTREDKNQWITHESWVPGRTEMMFVDWPKGMQAVDINSGKTRRVTDFNAWHAISNRQGDLAVADTNFPDKGLILFDPRKDCGPTRTLCHPKATCEGEHWNGPFPYNSGPITVYAPQHTHPHPSFSPDGSLVAYTSDCSGHAQVYEVKVPEEAA